MTLLVDPTFLFFVAGAVTPQGSKQAGVSVNGKVFVREQTDKTGKLSTWRNAVNNEARRVATGRLLDGPLDVLMEFWLPRPKSHPKHRRTWPIGQNTGDASKLARAVEDALKGVLITDDSRIVHLDVWKDYTNTIWTREGPPGVQITIREFVQ